jgi:hypothetical protein
MKKLLRVKQFDDDIENCFERNGMVELRQRSRLQRVGHRQGKTDLHEREDSEKSSGGSQEDWLGAEEGQVWRKG